MNIPNREKKPEGAKKIKEVAMYTILLEQGNVFDFELGLHCENPSDRRKFERYANELHEVGATPKMRLKTQKIIESGKVVDKLHYYEAPEVLLEFAQLDINGNDSLEEGELYRLDIKKPLYRNKYSSTHKFKYHKNKPTSFRLARVLCMIYFNRSYIDFELKNGNTRFREFYFKKVNPGASEKTYERDKELYLYAIYTSKLEIEDIRKKYRNYIKKIRCEN